jgi:hypothetical protein
MLEFSVLVPHQRRQGENVKLLDGLLYWGLSQRGAKKTVKTFLVRSLDFFCIAWFSAFLSYRGTETWTN